MKRISLLLVAPLLIVSCSTLFPALTPPPPAFTQEPSNVLPDPTDPSRPITVTAGETFEIALASNSSTGYRWKLIGELDESIVQMVEQDYIAQLPVIPGSGGVDIWTFSGVGPGDASIVLGYFPPSGDTEPDQTLTFLIHVK